MHKWFLNCNCRNKSKRQGPGRTRVDRGGRANTKVQYRVGHYWVLDLRDFLKRLIEYTVPPNHLMEEWKGGEHLSVNSHPPLVKVCPLGYKLSHTSRLLMGVQASQAAGVREGNMGQGKAIPVTHKVGQHLCKSVPWNHDWNERSGQMDLQLYIRDVQYMYI